MRVASTDGVSVAVHDLGGDGDVLLLAHATGFHGRAYLPLAATLAPHFHVLALDFRGHGDTPAPANGRFDWGGMADDLAAVIAAVSDGPIRVFGHSMGGGAALLVEARIPRTLRAAYLFEPIVVPTLEMFGGERPADPDFMSAAARRRKPLFASKAEAMLRYASRPPLEELRAGSLAAYVEYGFEEVEDGTVRLKCRPEDEAATFEAEGKPTLEQLAGINTPVTVAIGTTEQGWSPAMFGPAVADALLNGRLEEHPALGHFGPLQDPRLIATGIVQSVK
jgi:pimeloyl-ACP methyl ester carboxylesterase